MNIFGTVKLTESLADCLVVANAYEDPMNYLKEYGVDFLDRGILAFDLSLMCGMLPDHYAYVRVEDHRVIPKTYVRVNDLDKSALTAACDYFNSHKDIVDEACIPSSIKAKLLSGWYIGQ